MEEEIQDKLEQIYNLIRGLSPCPSAWSPMYIPTEKETVDVKILKSEKVITVHNLQVGTLQTDGKEYIHIAAIDGFIAIKELQLPGKKRLAVDELLRGYDMSNDFYMLTE